MPTGTLQFTGGVPHGIMSHFDPMEEGLRRPGWTLWGLDRERNSPGYMGWNFAEKIVNFTHRATIEMIFPYTNHRKRFYG